MERLLLRPNEAADLLGLWRSKVYELLAIGEIPSVRVGGLTRIPADALRRWILDQSGQEAPGRNSSHSPSKS